MEFLKSIGSESNVNIPYSKENVFCFDSEAFRYLAIEANKLELNVKEKPGYQNSWKFSARASQDLINYIENRLKGMDMKNLIALNDSKDLNNNCSMAAIELVKTLLAKRKIMKDKDYNSFCSRLIGLTAEFSSLISKNSVTVYNDTFEAYLEEAIQKEIQETHYKPKNESRVESYKNFLKNYKSKKLSLKSTTSMDLNDPGSIMNAILDMQTEFNLNKSKNNK